MFYRDHAYFGDTNIDASLISHVQSMPFEIEWAGWRSTTTDLQRAGWQLSADEDVYNNTIRLAVKHDQIGAHGYGSADFTYLHAISSLNLNRGMVRFNNMQFARDFILHDRCGYDKFQPINAYPQISEPYHLGKLSDFKIFRPNTVIDKQLIVPEYDVDNLLSMILEKQQSARIERITEEIKTRPAQQVHAQIVSLRA